jgi:hypothetical protein
MEAKKQTHIRYSIPKANSYQVALFKRKPKPAFDLLKNWLDSHTKYYWEPEIEFQFWSPEEVINSSKGTALLTEIESLKPLSSSIAQDGSIFASRWAYKCSFERLSETVSLTEKYYALLKSSVYSSFTVSACAHCLFLGSNGEVIPGQSYANNNCSSFTIHLNHSSTLWPNFYLPFDNQKDFLVFYKLVKDDLPFKIKDNYWKLFLYNENTGKTIIKSLFDAT